MNKYRDELVERIKLAGHELIDRAESMVSPELNAISDFNSGGKKNPVLVCLENLRKDIGSYSDRLRLNAKAYETETIPDKKEKSVFAKLLDENRQDDAS